MSDQETPQPGEPAFGSAEHRELRARAFGKNATDTDARALLTYENRAGLHTSPPPGGAESPEEAEDEPQLGPVTEPGTVATAVRTSGRRRAIRYVIGVSVVVFAFAGGWVLSTATTTVAPRSSLEVFDRPATDADASPIFTQGFSSFEPVGSIVITESRFLGELDGRALYGGLGMVNNAREGDAPVFQTMICLSEVTSDGGISGGAGCVPLKEFLTRGIAVGLGDERQYQWGPTGVVTVVAPR